MAESEAAAAPVPPAGSSTEARMNRESINKESIKKGFSDFRKFAGTNFFRAKQYMTEKAGKADEVTAFDDDFESLCFKVDQIKLVTERMLAQVESLVQPNPNVRLENWALSKLDRPKPVRSNSHQWLGRELERAADSFGAETQYGAYLLNCSRVESKIGESQKRFEEKVARDIVTPLRAFLEVDIKTLQRDRKVLSVRRLDLDATKTSNRKAQGDKVATTEMAVREAQAAYDDQLRKLRLAMQKVVDTHVNNMGHLRAFMEAQAAFHAECQAHLEDLQKVGPPKPPTSVETEEPTQFTAGGLVLDREDSRKARMLYDYDAVNEDEITINSQELLTVTRIPDDDEYVMAEYQGKVGKIPSTYVEFL